MSRDDVIRFAEDDVYWFREDDAYWFPDGDVYWFAATGDGQAARFHSTSFKTVALANAGAPFFLAALREWGPRLREDDGLRAN
jgi:hypothetical protein